MTAPSPEQTSKQLTDKLTDDALRTELNKLKRMISRRKEDRSELSHEICELEQKHDALLEVQVARLQGQKMTTATDAENDSAQ